MMFSYKVLLNELFLMKLSIDQVRLNLFSFRYEREEAFYSLPVTVKNLRLEDSLEQFVNGEILEGDNAYFCEKCNERVRMIIILFSPISPRAAYVSATYQKLYNKLTNNCFDISRTADNCKAHVYQDLTPFIGDTAQEVWLRLGSRTRS
jgi:hypothetical protein